MNTYLETISKSIKNKTAKKAIIAELQAHIEEKKEYYIEIGYSEQEAETKAIEEMGEAEEAAVSFNGLYVEKWYKQAINIIALFIYALILAFCSIGDYDYGNVLNSHEHMISMDIYSTLILGFFVIVLVTAFKRKNKFLAFSVPCFISLLFVLGVISNFILSSDMSMMDNVPPYVFTVLISLRSWYMLFTPFLYLIVTVFTKGPLGYYNSVLNNEIFDMNIRYVYNALSVVIFLLLISFGVLIIVDIIKRERMKSDKKFSKLIKFPLRAFSLFTAVNLAVLLFSGVFAYINISRDEIQSTRYRMISCVIDAKGFNSGKDTVLKDMKVLNLPAEQINEGEYVSCNYIYYNSKISYLKDILSDSSDVVLGYTVNLYSSPAVIGREDLTVDSAALDKLKTGKCKLKDFKNEDIFDKAISAVNQGKIITLHYITNANTTVQLTFVNGILNEKYNFDENNQVIEEPATTEETLPPTTLSLYFN